MLVSLTHWRALLICTGWEVNLTLIRVRLKEHLKHIIQFYYVQEHSPVLLVEIKERKLDYASLETYFSAYKTFTYN